MRELSNEKMEWTFAGNDPSLVVRRQKLIEALHEQMQACVTPSLQAKMVSGNTRQLLEALQQLTEALHLCFDAVVESLDVILKWSTLLFECNQEVAVRNVEFLLFLFAKLDESHYQLTNYEATCFLNVFMQHGACHGKTSSDIFQKIGRIYPSKSLFDVILTKGLQIRDVPWLVECIHQLQHLLKISFVIPLEMCTLSESLPIIARHLSNKNQDVRDAIAECLREVFQFVEEDIWKYMVSLSETDLEFVKEVLEMKPKQNGIQNSSSEKITDSKELSVPSKIGNEQLSASPKLQLASSQTNQDNIEACIERIIAFDPPGTIEIIKVLCDYIKRDDEVVLPHVNALVTKLTKEMEKALRATPFSSRICKYFIDALMHVITRKHFCSAVCKDVLQLTVKSLLCWLADDSLLRVDDGKQICRALNSLMLKLLDNMDKTTCFVILLRHMTESVLPLEDMDTLLNQVPYPK